MLQFSEVEQKILNFEKEKEADAKRIADLEYALSSQVGLHRSKVEGLEKKVAQKYYLDNCCMLAQEIYVVLAVSEHNRGVGEMENLH
ncbi:hypothetical protein ACJX0J_007931, partial [Zea mays]